MVVDMETKDGLKRCAITKNSVGTCRPTQLYISKNILLLLCTPMALIYNSELGVFISSEFFPCKETPEEVGKNIGQNIAGCSLMWLMPLRSLSNCDYEL